MKARPVCLQGYDDHSEIRVEKIDGMAMVRKMAIKVQTMMQHKIDAVKRIMEMAENLALDHMYDKVRVERLRNDSGMVLTANKHFSGAPVNLSYSSLHGGPTNASDEELEVINAVDWSGKLENTFKDNFERDPSLSWQFFGSSTGFLRQV